MKKLIALTLVLAMMFTMVACGTAKEEPTEAPTATPAPAQDSYYPVTVTSFNQEGEMVDHTYTEAPTSTLVYGLNNVEIMLSLGLVDNIRMTADCSTVLDELTADFETLDHAKDFQEVGYFERETSLTYEPDMVIGWKSLFAMDDRMGDVEWWHERNVGTYITSSSVLADGETIDNCEFEDIRQIAKIYNKVEEGEAIIAEMQADIAKGVEASKGSDAKKVLILENWKGEYDIFGPGEVVGDLANRLGAEALGVDGWTDEEIVVANPDVIFAVHVGSVSDEEAIALYSENPSLQSVTAVKNGEIYPVKYGLAYAPGMRIKQTIALFLDKLYGIE